MSFIEENVIFGFVADVGAKVLADYAVPVGAVLLIEFLFDMFGHEIFHFEVVDGIFGLNEWHFTSFMASAIMSDPSGISMMFYFLIASVAIL